MKPESPAFKSTVSRGESIQLLEALLLMPTQPMDRPLARPTAPTARAARQTLPAPVQPAEGLTPIMARFVLAREMRRPADLLGQPDGAQCTRV